MREFIKSVLTDIIGGVVDAREEVKGTSAIIAPMATNGLPGERVAAKRNDGFMMMQDVEFEVALSEAHNTEAGGGIGVALGKVGISGKAKKGTETGSLTNIKFTVPISFPFPK